MQAVLLTLCSAFFFAVGHALQKQGVSRRFRVDSRERGARGPGWLFGLVREPIWLAGVGSVLLASALDLQAVSLGDLTLVKPLLGLQAAFAVAIGVGLLGERVGRSEGAAVAALALGGVLVAFTVGPSEPRLVPGWDSAGVFAVSLGGAVGLAVAYLRFPRRLRGEAAFGLGAGLMFGVSDFMMKRATSIVVSASGDFSVLDPGSLGSLLRTPEILWIVAANVVAFLLMQLAYTRGRVAVVSPLATLSGTAFAVVLGFSVLAEPLSTWRVAGIALVLLATAALVRAGPASRRAAE